MVEKGKGRRGDTDAGGVGRGEGGASKQSSRSASPKRGATDGLTRPADLRSELRDFASARPSGWQHDDWLHFLESLKNRGHDIHDREAIGIALEKERLDLALSSIKGVGPQRRQALVERYGTVWSLRNAPPDEIASVGKMPLDLARRVKEGMG